MTYILSPHYPLLVVKATTWDGFFRMKPQKPRFRVEKDPSCSKDLGEEHRHQFCSFSSSVAKSSVSSIKRGDQQRTKKPINI